jgi:PAS domain S-box-containing protein
VDAPIDRGPGTHDRDEDAPPSRRGVAGFLRQRQDAILRAWEARVSSERHEVAMTGLALRDDIPELLDELAAWLASDAPPETSLAATRALAHVLQRLDAGLSLAQVLREYRLLRELLIEELLGAEAAEAVEQERAGAPDEGGRASRIEELARLNAGLDVVLSQSIEHFVAQREVRAAAERARASHAVAESETRYRALFESIDEGFCILEVLLENERPVDYRFLAVNPAFVRHTGLAHATGKRMRELFPDHDDHGVEIYGRVATTGQPARFEERALSRGRVYEAYAYRVGEPARRHVAVLFNDINERKEIEEKLQRALAEADAGRQLLDAIMDNVPEGITIADAPDVRIRKVSRYGQLLTGKPRDALEGITVDEHAQAWELLDTDGLVAKNEALPLTRATQQGEVVRDEEWVLGSHAGERIPISCNASPIRDAAGIIVGGIVAWRDIRDRKRAEAALQRANLELAAADRRKDEFLAVLSHELRNPLGPIVNSLAILDLAPPGGAQAERAKQVIGRQVTHLSNLVNDLLDVTRITHNKIDLKQERLELSALVRLCVEDHRSAFGEAEVRLELVPAARPVLVQADRTRLAQVVGNLLRNAAKFTHKGGQTRVAVATEGSEAVVRVADDGVGMTRETLDGLFHPFAQAAQPLDRSRGGLGLGLALVKGLVELHGGSVSAGSDGLGRGAEMIVRLPLDSGSALEGAPRTPLIGGRLRVLLVEDDADAAYAMSKVLAFDGHEVAVAYDGEAGIANARASTPDVVFCDIGLPGVNGYDVARALRSDEALARTYLVALSGYGRPKDLQLAQDAGFHRHLLKPTSLDEIKQLLAGMPGRSW